MPNHFPHLKARKKKEKVFFFPTTWPSGRETPGGPQKVSRQKFSP